MSATDETTTAVSRALSQTGEALRAEPSVRSEVMRRVTQAALAPQQLQRPSMMRRYRWRALSALAACLIVGLVLMQLQGVDRASEAFAQAISAVAKAHTFSCRQISQNVQDDGKIDSFETVYMFKEPDHARLEWRSGLQRDGQITIVDFAKRRRLTLNGNKTDASLEDISKTYEVDQQTGELLPLSLDTDVREQVMRLTAESVKDLGKADLNGKSMRVFRSIGKKSGSVRTVYVDPDTNQPVQIVLEYPQTKGSKWTFADIQIDQPLDDSLFSLDVPAGYKLFKDGPYVPAQEHYSKIMIKMRSLGMALMMYANDHDGIYPADLSTLVGPDMSEKKLKTLLAAPDQSDGPAVIVYRQPNKNTKDYGNEVVFYEKPESRLDKKVCAAFLDGHAQVMEEAEFDEVMKKQSR
jgi:outer membrane lipoprotein-sorting protein